MKSPLDRLKEIDSEINQHPGNKISMKIINIERVTKVWSDFAESFYDLLIKCETDQDMILAVRYDEGENYDGPQVRVQLDQFLLAYLTGLVSLIDQSRPLISLLSEDNQQKSESWKNKILTDYPQGLFFAKLRNYVVHFLAAPWLIIATYGMEDFLPESGTIALDTKALLEWDGWKGSRKFVEDSNPRIRISSLINPHFRATREYFDWLVEVVRSDNIKDFDAANELIEKRNSLVKEIWGDEDD